MRKYSLLITICVIAAVALNLMAQKRKHDQIMKEVSATFTSLRQRIESKTGSEAAQDAAKLESLFKEVEDFWLPFKTKDALGFARDAQTAAGVIAASAKEGDFEKAQSAYGSIGKNCKGCHDSHRVQMPDKSYRIRP
ncbi:MAG: cytochrome c [Acidobacteria bacterium]|nr:cytochrome c [Acidobacteriota bacterium]